MGKEFVGLTSCPEEEKNHKMYEGKQASEVLPRTSCYV
jgi:hypothetical protein